MRVSKCHDTAICVENQRVYAPLIERRSHVVGTLAVIGAILGLSLLFLAFGAGA
jgi:hypothetical protein